MNETSHRSALRIATMQDSTIAAVVEGLFRLESKELAAEKLKWIGIHFIRAKEQDAPQNKNSPTLRLWVQGFGLTPGEKKQGYRGNYARFSVAATGKGRFTIHCEKIIVDLARHPQKNRPKLDHADWGYPTLRAAQSGRIFKDVTTARSALIKMHEEFSATTTPGQDKLYVRLYNRKLLSADAAPIEKLTLKIKILPDGTAQLVIKKPAPRQETKNNDGSPEQKGKFATMVKQRRPRKAPRTDS